MNSKNFVNNFNFPSPNWNELPSGFPKITKNGLTKEEGHLLDAIVLAWITSEGKGYLVRKVARRMAALAVIIFVALVGGSVIAGRIEMETVSAKTVGTTVGKMVEATMSAVFR